MQLANAEERFGELRARKLNIKAQRGVPATDMLETAAIWRDWETAALLRAAVPVSEFNYGGGYMGLEEFRALMSPFVRAEVDDIVAWGTSTLDNIGYFLTMAMHVGLADIHKPLKSCINGRPKVLVLEHSYDRWLKTLLKLGYQIVKVPRLENGDLDAEFVLHQMQDRAVVGMILTARLDNPTGHTHSEQVLRALIESKPAFRHFFIIEDDAYFTHTESGKPVEVFDLVAGAREADFSGQVIRHLGLSKVLSPGSSPVVWTSSCRKFLALWRAWAPDVRGIGTDKLTQRAAVQFFRGNPEHLIELMGKLGAMVAPKFHALHAAHEEHLAPLGGRLLSAGEGYFALHIGRNAERVHQLMAELGITLTPPGSTCPEMRYDGLRWDEDQGEFTPRFVLVDPDDAHTRLAITSQSPDDIRTVVEAMAVCEVIAQHETTP